MKKKRAFITGITGQDGSYLAEFLLNKGYEVWGMVRRNSTDPFERIIKIKDKLNLRNGNLMDSYSIYKILKESKPHEIYNLAAQSHVGISFDCPIEAEEINYLGLVRLVERVKELKLDSKIYQASTSEMFGNSTKDFINEKTPFDPQSPYAKSKLNSYEKVIIPCRDKDKMFICSGFLFNHESPRRGENFVTKKITEGLTKIKLGLKDKLSLGNLDAKRDWGFAGDYVEAMWLMLQQKTPRDYVIGTGETHSVREFLEKCANYAGLKIHSNGKEGLEEKYIDKKGKTIVDINPKFFRPAEVNVLLADASKARKELGWIPKVSFEKLIKIMMDYDFRHI